MTRKRRKRSPKPIGWREWVALPDLGIDAVKAKVDTGARTSALHAVRVATARKGGIDFIRFSVHPQQRKTRPSVRCEAALIDERYVRSSDGTRELRPVVETTIQLGDDAWTIELTLTDRAMMGFRLLLGRRAIRRRFLVDPGRSWLASERQ
ncbi:MAG: ATP-dependent zinc protease [Acidobacteria bacterium]|nr:ATP-dependent zinc protease [Acidobacteriota bacterium]